MAPQIQKTHRLTESEKKSAGFLNLWEIIGLARHSVWCAAHVEHPSSFPTGTLRTQPQNVSRLHVKPASTSPEHYLTGISAMTIPSPDMSFVNWHFVDTFLSGKAGFRAAGINFPDTSKLPGDSRNPQMHRHAPQARRATAGRLLLLLPPAGTGPSSTSSPAI